MTWLCATMRVSVLIPAMVVLGVVTAAFPHASIAFPTLDQGVDFRRVPLAVIAPVIALTVISACTSAGAAATTAVAARRHPAVLNAVVLGLTLAFVGAHLSASLAVGRGDDVGAARNALGLAGLLFICQNLTGVRAAILGPVLYVVIEMLFSRAGGEPVPWAWLLHTSSVDDVPVSLAIAVCTSAVSSVIAERPGGRFYPRDPHA